MVCQHGSPSNVPEKSFQMSNERHPAITGCAAPCAEGRRSQGRCGRSKNSASLSRTISFSVKFYCSLALKNSFFLTQVSCAFALKNTILSTVSVCGKSIGLCCLAVLRLAPTTFIKPVLQGWGEVKYKRVGMGRDLCSHLRRDHMHEYGPAL